MDARAAYDEICDDLAARTPGAQLTQMMGMPCLKVDGKLIAGWERSEEAMVFRLQREGSELARALSLEGAHLFDPSGKGRPFRDWVVVPAAHAAEWAILAEQALALRGAS